MALIYLVDDEKNLNQLLAEYLKREGHTVRSFYDGISAMNEVSQSPDVWVLDIMLPDIDGYALLKKIKANDPTCPVMFISAKNDQLDRVVGLELGSDDYLPKPFLPRELVIRVGLLLQKREQNHTEPTEVVDLYEYEINITGRMIDDHGVSITLTHKEWQLLCYFLNNIDLVVTREQILQRVWDDNYYGSSRVVDDTLRRLRKKMPRLAINTVYQMGYKLVRP